MYTDMQLLGYDLGSSSVKACLIDARNGAIISQSVSPESEMKIQSPQKGWAEQEPEIWWRHVKKATEKLMESEEAKASAIEGIGIAYQMHGLVMVDDEHKVLAPSIIWCDGRAVEIGAEAFEEIGREYCLEHYLNSPGNFTASKLRWVMENRPELYSRIHKILLPGDYLAMKLTGELRTTLSGLSEGIFWDFKEEDLAHRLLDHYGISPNLLPERVPNMGIGGRLTGSAADCLGLKEGIPVSYRAGDQPNNALSLNVMEPGEVAANAGTSGVIYGVTDRPVYDQKSRVNTFVHLGHRRDSPRYGVLLCINGTGIQYSWLKSHMLGDRCSYDEMNDMASDVPAGSEGVVVLPFGNGPERVLENNEPGALFRNLDFNRHGDAHIIRAAQEGIAFAMSYGMKLMQGLELDMETVRVGSDNMFRSPVFCEAFVNTTGADVEVYRTNGAMGAALGAGMGAGIYEGREEAFKNLEKVKTLQPDAKLMNKYKYAYERWVEVLLAAL